MEDGDIFTSITMPCFFLFSEEPLEGEFPGEEPLPMTRYHSEDEDSYRDEPRIKNGMCLSFLSSFYFLKILRETFQPNFYPYQEFQASFSKSSLDIAFTFNLCVFYVYCILNCLHGENLFNFMFKTSC